MGAAAELSAYKVGRYVKSAEAYEEARKLAAEDMDQLFKDAQKDRIVVRDEQRDMWSDSKWRSCTTATGPSAGSWTA